MEIVQGGSAVRTDPPKSQEVLIQSRSETPFRRSGPKPQSGAHSKKPRVVRGLRLPQGLLSRFEVFVLAGQTIRHHKPPKFLMGKQIKHLVSSSSF